MNKRTFLVTAASVFAATTFVTAAHAAPVHCGGTNACKGQSACKGASNGAECVQGPRLHRSQGQRRLHRQGGQDPLTPPSAHQFDAGVQITWTPAPHRFPEVPK